MRSADPHVLAASLLGGMAGGQIVPTKQFDGILDATVLDTDKSAPTLNPIGMCRITIPTFEPNTVFGPVPYPVGSLPTPGVSCVVGFVAPQVNSTAAATVRILTVSSPTGPQPGPSKTQTGTANIAQPWTYYTPAWTASINPPSVGNGSLKGRYMRLGRKCDFQVFLALPASWSGGGGSGYWLFGLPFPTGAGFAESDFFVKYYNAQFAISLTGFAYCAPGSTSCIPYAPQRIGSNWDMAGMCNESSAGAGPATSIPYMGGGAGAYAFGTAGGNLFIGGSYETA